MSHFTVLVIGPNPEAQLKPYDEKILVEPYPEPVSEEWLERALELLKEKIPERTWVAADGSPVDDFTLRQIVTELNADPDDEDEYLVHKGKVCYLSRYNPEAKYDWYQVGGRWRGFFPLKPDIEWRREMLGESGLGGDDIHQLQRDRLVDVAAVGNVDFKRARDEAEKEAQESFAKWRALFEKHGRPRGWKEISAQIDTEIGKLKEGGIADEIVGKLARPGSWIGVLERLRNEYRTQAAIAAQGGRFQCPVDWFGFDEEIYVQRMRRNSLVPYALVKDGKWYAQGEMGWWGCSRDEKDENTWCEEVQRLFDDLPPETLLTLYDCHI